MSVCGVPRELDIWRMKKHEIEVWVVSDVLLSSTPKENSFGVSRELAHENMLISFCVRVWCVA